MVSRAKVHEYHCRKPAALPTNLSKRLTTSTLADARINSPTSVWSCSLIVDLWPSDSSNPIFLILLFPILQQKPMVLFWLPAAQGLHWAMHWPRWRPTGVLKLGGIKMKVEKVTKIGLVVALAISSVACGVGVGEDTAALGEGEDAIEVDDFADGKADAYSDLSGTWLPPVADGPGFSLLAFLRNKKYHSERSRYCDRPCPQSQQNGTYRLTRRGFKRYVTLSPHAAQPVKLEYKLTSAGLKIKNVNATQWFTFSRNHGAWCGAPADCLEQPFIHPMCAGQSTCNANSCGWSCRLPPR